MARPMNLPFVWQATKGDQSDAETDHGIDDEFEASGQNKEHRVYCFARNRNPIPSGCDDAGLLSFGLGDWPHGMFLNRRMFVIRVFKKEGFGLG